MQTPEDMILEYGIQNYDDGIVSKRGFSDGFAESSRNSCNPDGEMLELFGTSQMHWAKDETGTSESRREPSDGSTEPSNGLMEPSWNSSHPYSEMPEPSSSHISHEDGLSYLHADGGLHHSSSSYKNDFNGASFETSNHRELFDYCSADLVTNNQQSSDVGGANSSPFETSNYSKTPSLTSFSNVHHKQDSFDYYHQNHDRDPLGMEYSFMSNSGNVTENSSNKFSSAYRVLQSNIKVEKNTVVTPSTNLASRASELVDSANGGQGIELSLSKILPSGLSKNCGTYAKAETEDGLFHSSRAHPFPVKSSDVAAQSHSSKVSYQGVQSKTSDQSNAEDDSDLCVLEDMSDPRPNHVAKQVMTSRDQTMITHSRRKPNDERVIFRVALQVTSLNSSLLSSLARVHYDIPLTYFWCT